MFLLLVKTNSLDTYNLCYKFHTIEKAQEQYNILLEKYPPTRLNLVETAAIQFGISYEGLKDPVVGPLFIPMATSDSAGIVRLATNIEADFGTPIDTIDGEPLAVQPSLIKHMIEQGLLISVPTATTEITGKVRLSNSVENDYDTANNGSDGLAVIQPKEAKEMINKAAIYTTDYTPSVNNIKEALDDIYNQINYIPLSIINFTATKTLCDIGKSVDITFNWEYNKDILRQNIDSQEIEPQLRTITKTISNNRTISLVAEDEKQESQSSISINFTWRIYWGTSNLEETLSSVFVNSLSKSKLNLTKEGLYDFDVPSGKFGYIASPASYGMSEFVFINGWKTNLNILGVFSYTNLYNETTDYIIMKTTRSGLGSFLMEVQ